MSDDPWEMVNGFTRLPAVVGENGPELVNLTIGTDVHYYRTGPGGTIRYYPVTNPVAVVTPDRLAGRTATRAEILAAARFAGEIPPRGWWRRLRMRFRRDW